MKFLSFWAVYLPLILAVSACAKKPNEEGREVLKSSVQPVETNSIPKCMEEIRDAISLNQPDRINSLISKTIEFQPSHLNQVFSDGETLLTHAVMVDSLKSRDLLLELGADINMPNIHGETPLIVAARLNKENSVSKLVFEKARLDDKDNKGNTALIWSLRNASESDALFLINSGANVEITNNENRNATSYAHEKSMVQVLELLTTRMQVSYGTADVTSFMSVLTNGDYQTLDKMLMESKSIVKDYEDVNPLVLVLKVQDTNAASRMAISLLKNGASINGPKNAQTTPLIKAVEYLNHDFVKFFLDDHANVNAVDKDGKSALIYAIEKNNFEIVNALLRSYADKKYSFVDKDGKKRSFNACTTVRETYHSLEAANDLVINEKIRNRLNCRFLWFR